MGKPKVRNRRFNSGVGRNSFRYKVRKRKEKEASGTLREDDYHNCVQDSLQHETLKRCKYKIVRKSSIGLSARIVVKRLPPIVNFHKRVRMLRIDDSGTKMKVHNPTPTPEGYRIINVDQLARFLPLILSHGVKCPSVSESSPFELSEVSVQSLASTLRFKCKACGENIDLQTSFAHEGSNNIDINLRAVWGTMTGGGGSALLNEMMTTLGVGSMRREIFTKTENWIGNSWLKLLEDDMRKAGVEERELAIKRKDFHQGVPAITVICDGGWSKRSHKHTYNALGGVAVIFGAATGKLLHIGVRNKYCSICTIAESKKGNPPKHQCFRNWSESSQAMESDIILEGFQAAEKVHGLRFMRLIGDGDSSVYARIQEQVPVWGREVKKLECANHVCKCLRSNLEKLVQEKPHLKGKGRLSKQAIMRITRGVRCAIRLRSTEETRSSSSQRMLAHDIYNTVNHVFGDHSRCSDFCKKRDESKIPEERNDNEEEDHDGLDEIVDMWKDVMDDEKMDEARNAYVYEKDGSIDLEILKDVRFLLERVATKSAYLLGNFTTNLAESWMSVRCKFDGGKTTNRCQRGSWHTRCYGGALRKNFGTAWSPIVWQKATGVRPTNIFTGHYHQRARELINSKKYKAKPETRVRAAKRKAESVLKCTSKRARREYGENCLDGAPDISPEALETCKLAYLANEIEISTTQIKQIESKTVSQSFSSTWTSERRKRLTSSNFGDIVNKSTTSRVSPLVSRLLYSKFSGNKYTRKGLQAESVTIKEYIHSKAQTKNLKVNVKQTGLVIDCKHKFLAASPDGYVEEGTTDKGLLEIKNLLQTNILSFEEAAKKSTFCLELFEKKLRLKRNHKYYYQCQGQLNICNCEWLDFVVRRTNPYQIHIERIKRDENLWNSFMVPKLKAFYYNCVLPELASPRKTSLQGIREPVKPWYIPQAISAPKEGTPKVGTASHQKKKKKSATARRGSDSDEPGPSRVNFQEVRVRGRRQRRTKFVGRHIIHQWCTDETTQTLEWYEGTVLDCVKGVDGGEGAVYEVQYKGEEEPYEIDHLQEDLDNGSLKFRDL